MLATKLQIPRERRTTAVLTYLEDGQLQELPVTVVYRPMSAAVQREFHTEVVGPDGKYQFADYVARFVVAIPELQDEAGQAVAITPEFVWSLSVENVTALHDAVEADQNPKAIVSSLPAG